MKELLTGPCALGSFSLPALPSPLLCRPQSWGFSLTKHSSTEAKHLLWVLCAVRHKLPQGGLMIPQTHQEF